MYQLDRVPKHEKQHAYLRSHGESLRFLFLCMSPIVISYERLLLE